MSTHTYPDHHTTQQHKRPQDNTREEWKEHYIDYKALKKALKPLKAGAKGKPWLKRGGSMVGGAGEASDSGMCVRGGRWEGLCAGWCGLTPRPERALTHPFIRPLGNPNRRGGRRPAVAPAHRALAQGAAAGAGGEREGQRGGRQGRRGGKRR